MFTDQNLTLMTDLYQLTMMQGYYHYGKKDRTVVFDLFYCENPFSAAFSIVAGLDQAEAGQRPIPHFALEGDYAALPIGRAACRGRV